MTEYCDHVFAPLGFEVVSKDEDNVETVAAIFCEKCGLFRTKILKFDRSLVSMPAAVRSKKD